MVDSPKIVNRGSHGSCGCRISPLDFRRRSCYADEGRPDPLLREPPARVSVDGKKPLGHCDQAVLFLGPLHAPAARSILILGRPELRLTQQNLCHFVALKGLNNAGPPARVVSNAYGPSGPQNNGFVSFAEVLPPPSTRYYQTRAQMSSPFSARLCPATAAPGAELLVCHRVDQRHLKAAMIESPANSIDVAVLP